MQLLPSHSRPAARIPRRREEAIAPEILDLRSPSATIVAAPVPGAARGTIWVIASMFAACLTAMWLIPIDRTVTARGKVVSRAPTLVVQPLDTAIIRSIDVTEGESVRAGDLLARLDPTFAAADMGSLAAQVSSLRAEVSRLQAEAAGRPFTYDGTEPDLALQAAIDAQRRSERSFKLETYRQRIDGLQATVARSMADVQAYKARKAVAEKVEAMRQELARLRVGSQLNWLAATDNRLEMERGLADAAATAQSARRDLDAMKAERDEYNQKWQAEISQKLSEQTQKLADAVEQLNKAQLRHKLVELRADRDATVLTVAKVSVGSVLQSGDQFITLVPAEAQLEIEADIGGRDDGFVHVGAPVAVKFDTFPFAQYGVARGRVRTISADSFTAEEDAKTRFRSGSPPANPAGSTRFYRSRITLDEVKLHGVPEGFRVLPGMPMTADIKVGQRTVLLYLLGRVMPVVTNAMREP